MAIHADSSLEKTGQGERANALSILGRGVFLVSLPSGILNFGLPIYGREIGADAIQIGLFFSVFSLMTALLRPVVGAALDQHGRRWFLLLGMVGYGLTMFAFAAAGQVWGIVVARMFQGVSSAFMWLAARAVVADLVAADTRAHAFGRVDQFATRGEIAGTTLGMMLLFSLSFEAGWGLLFVGYGIVNLIAAYWTWRRFPETHALNATMSTVNEPSRDIHWSQPWILLLLVTAVTGASWALISPILMIFLQDRLGADPAQLAWVFLPSALVWAVLPARLGRLADRWGRKWPMVLGLAVAALSSFVIPKLTTLAGFAALWAVQALSYAIGDPAEQALVADLVGPDRRGKGYGLYALAAVLGATVGPLVGGWLYETVGPQAPFYANGVILALCGLALTVFLHVPRP